jgi:hypothetical protein
MATLLAAGRGKRKKEGARRKDFVDILGRPVTLSRGLVFDGVELVPSAPSPLFSLQHRPSHSPTSLDPNIGKSLGGRNEIADISLSMVRPNHGCAPELSLSCEGSTQPARIQGIEKPGGWTET